MSHQKTTRNEVVAAAAELLAEDRISRFSIGRVCERAGLSRRSFFNYFKDKDELWAEVLKSLQLSHKKAMEDWSAELADDLSVEQRILAIFNRILAIITVPTWRGSAFIRLSGEISELDDHPIHQLIARTKLDQEDWFERELLRENFAAPRELATQLTIVMNGLFQLQLLHRSPHLGQAVLSMIPVLLASHRTG